MMKEMCLRLLYESEGYLECGFYHYKSKKLFLYAVFTRGVAFIQEKLKQKGPRLLWLWGQCKTPQDAGSH